MDVGEIRKLVRLMEEAGLTELEVEDRSGKIRLVRGAASARDRERAASRVEPDDPAEAASGRPTVAPAAERAPLDSDGAGPHIPPGMTAITSPMVGTFYRAASPDGPPFVSPGDVVQAGQVVCIIEAMKMMNEVCAEAPARVVSVQAENASAVEYGSPLFLVELLE